MNLAMGKNPGKRILIADDTLPLRVMLEEVLTGAGYEVFTAGDGVETWDLICSHGQDLDLLVLDLLMPKMSGFEVLSRLQEELPNKKFIVLVLSGIFKSDKEILKLKELGANGYLNKSSVIDEILYRVNALFNIHYESERRFPRVACSLPIDYQFNGTKHSSHTTTVSLGGCFVRTLKPAPKDASVKLWMNFSELGCPEPLHLQGRVAWFNGYYTDFKPNSPPGMGIEFKELTEAGRKCLQTLVAKKLKEEEIWKA